MTSIECICISAPAPRSAQRRSVWQRIGQALGLRRQRARLLLLDPHLLRDIGITHEQAQTEAARPLWEAPPHWRG